MKKISCPDCGAKIVAGEKVEIGDILECSKCGTEVEVVSLSPFCCQELVEEK
ncbi:lysine biosynthesis protein LysW [Patescibacteria group bacterium]|nr:lysine biosynthesis protein LysW [Patescibacteria group bacterium]